MPAREYIIRTRLDRVVTLPTEERALGVPRCGGRRTGGDCYEYLGPSYDAQAKAYRLIYVRGQSVIHVYVDARTGRVMRVAR